MTILKSLATVALFAAFTSFSHRDITWVAIGDSITYLNDHPNETGDRVTKGYLTRVTDKLSYIHYINQGHNGWTAGHIASEIEKLGLVRADVYTVFLGTNDWWQGRPIGTMTDFDHSTGSGSLYGAYRIILDKLRSLNSDAKITLITPMQREDFVYLGDSTNNAWGSYKPKNGQTLEQFADAVKAIGEKEHLTVVDLYHDHKLSQKKLVKFKLTQDAGTGKAEPRYPMEAVGMTYDGLHPSDAGNAVIAKKLVKSLKKIR